MRGASEECAGELQRARSSPAGSRRSAARNRTLHDSIPSWHGASAGTAHSLRCKMDLLRDCEVVMECQTCGAQAGCSVATRAHPRQSGRRQHLRSATAMLPQLSEFATACCHAHHSLALCAQPLDGLALHLFYLHTCVLLLPFVSQGARVTGQGSFEVEGSQSGN